jgi:hypothetical protein
MLSLCYYVSPLTKYGIAEQVFMKLGIYITTPDKFVCLYVHLPTFAGERIGKNVNAATNSHAATEGFEM